MELFKPTNIDFLSKRWLALSLSAAFIVASIVSLIVRGGPNYGIDFRGGTLVYVKFAQTPPIDRIRSLISSKVQGEVTVTTVQDVAGAQADEIVIGTELRDEGQLDAARRTITQTLQQQFGGAGEKLDVNNASRQEMIDRLREPLQRAGAGLSEEQLEKLVDNLRAFRDKSRSGLLRSVDEFSAVPGVTPAVMGALKQELAAGAFAIRQVEIVGPKAGADLRRQAIMATLYALGGMLVYVAFRFELLAGVAAVLAIIHDTVITIGFFSFFNREISLTVIAALLTLIGYSMNDKIVIFDRVRENLKAVRRGSLEQLINTSINQTLSRTLLTAGPVLLCTIALYFLGGPVLNGIAYALFIGIIVGTYSSIFVASSILVFWENFQERRRVAARAGAAAARDKGSRSDLSRGAPGPKAKKG
ncbi:MAG: protein translocase subunit SecF [Bryobacterales bacterium]|nr:protein translocase subunit SecF [Bryobacterales bacterium]